MESHIDAIFYGITVLGMAIGLSKWAISRALRDLDYVVLKVNEIMIKLHKLDAHDTILKNHEEKIASIESIHDTYKKSI